MNLPAPQNDPHLAMVRHELEVVAASILDFQDALRGTNDRDSIDEYQGVIAAGKAMTELHLGAITRTIADDTVTLRSQFAKISFPREDPELGAVPSLTRLRGARAVVVADLDSLLEALRVHKITPSPSESPLPNQAPVEAGNVANLLAGLNKRLSELELALVVLGSEENPQDNSAQQTGLVNFFVSSLNVQLALAKAEASARTVVNLDSLARSVRAIGELTRDLVSTVRGMPNKVTRVFERGVDKVRGVVARVARGVRAILYNVSRSQRGPQPVTPTERLFETPAVYLVGSWNARTEFMRLLTKNEELTVRQFTSGDEFLEQSPNLPSGVVCLQDNMRGTSGLDVIRTLKQNQNFSSVMVIDPEDLDIALEALKAGANDFVEHIYSGQRVLRTIMASFPDERGSANKVSRISQAKAMVNTLTAREREILIRLVTRVPRSKIDTDLKLTPVGLEFYTDILMKKLRARSLTDALRIAFAAGLLD